MDKKNVHSPKVSGIHGIHQLILFLLFSTAIVFASPGKVITGIETYFSGLESALSTFGTEVSKYGAKRSKGPMEKMLQEYPGIEFLLWVNSKGVVVNEARREGKPGKPHRNLSRQKWFKKIKNVKLIADENELIISENEKIPYNAIQQIDKTHFESKGFFIITYKSQDGKDTLRALSYKKYDNLKAILEHLVSKIT